MMCELLVATCLRGHNQDGGTGTITLQPHLLGLTEKHVVAFMKLQVQGG